MNREELINDLKNKLKILENPQIETHAFNVFYAAFVPDPLKEFIVSVEGNGWQWGHCTSNTCSHNSHDPYTEGDVVHIKCAALGDGTYMTESGVLFFSHSRDEHGHHFCPDYSLSLLGKAA